MKKSTTKHRLRFDLAKETVKQLSNTELQAVPGGHPYGTAASSCFVSYDVCYG